MSDLKYVINSVGVMLLTVQLARLHFYSFAIILSELYRVAVVAGYARVLPMNVRFPPVEDQ